MVTRFAASRSASCADTHPNTAAVIRGSTAASDIPIALASDTPE